MKEIDELQARCASLERQISEARRKERECDSALQPLGAKKRNKPPEILAQIQAEIDSLRAEKQEAAALQKQLEGELNQARSELTKLNRVKELSDRQAERDKYAARQNNGVGDSPNQKRDTTWRF